MKWIGDGAIRSREQCDLAIKQFEIDWEIESFGLFSVELKQDGRLAGFTGLSRPKFLPEILPAVEIGWRFKREYWGKGLATEAAMAALDFGFHELRLPRIVSIFQIGNHGSRRIMEKLGMTLERETIDPSCGRKVQIYEIVA